MKVVAIQRGLENIKSQLENMGYKVCYHDEVNQPIDALVYYEETNSNYLKSVGQSLNNALFSGETDKAGTLLINAKDKDVNEIKRMIDSRLYSPLF